MRIDPDRKWKNRMIGFFFRLPLGLLMLFSTAAIIRAGWLMPLDFSQTGVAFPFLLGLCGGLVVFSLLCRFRLFYVFAHELTHWLTAKLFLRRTGRFRVGLSSGSVEIENPNLWITLSPYFIPLYTLFWSGFYFGLRQLQPLLVSEFGNPVIAGIGVTYAHHLSMTCLALGRHQRDLRAYGLFFSICMILFANAFILFIGVLAVTGAWRFGFIILGRLMIEQAELLWLWIATA